MTLAEVPIEIDLRDAPQVVRTAPARLPRPTVSLVLPALNEAENLPWVLERLPDLVDEVILVDGHSTDDTVAVARKLCPEVVVVQEQARGKGAAVRTGFDVATCDFIVMIDADGSMDPAEIGRFVDLLQSGFDVVKGSRFMVGGGSTDITRIRRLGNRALRDLVNGLYGQRFTDLCYGFFALRRDCVPDLALGASGFEIETEIVVRSIVTGMRMAEVPSFEAERLNGTSNLRSVRDGLRVLRTLVAHRVGGGALHAAVDDAPAAVVDLTAS